MVLSGQSVGGQQVLRVRRLGQRALLDLKAEENQVSVRAAPLEAWFRRLQWPENLLKMQTPGLEHRTQAAKGRGAWQATAYRAAKSRTRLGDLTATSHTELLDQKLWERSSATCITVKLPGGAGECWRTAALEWLLITSSM